MVKYIHDTNNRPFEICDQLIFDGRRTLYNNKLKEMLNWEVSDMEPND